MPQCMPVNSPDYRPVMLDLTSSRDSRENAYRFSFPEDHGFREVEFVVSGPDTLKGAYDLLTEAFRLSYGSMGLFAFRIFAPEKPEEFLYSLLSRSQYEQVLISISLQGRKELNSEQKERHAEILGKDVLEYLITVGVGVGVMPYQ